MVQRRRDSEEGSVAGLRQVLGRDKRVSDSVHDRTAIHGQSLAFLELAAPWSSWAELGLFLCVAEASCLGHEVVHEEDCAEVEACEHEEDTFGLERAVHQRLGREVEDEDDGVEYAKVGAEGNVAARFRRVGPRDRPRRVLVDEEEGAEHREDARVEAYEGEDCH